MTEGNVLRAPAVKAHQYRLVYENPRPTVKETSASWNLYLLNLDEQEL